MVNDTSTTLSIGQLDALAAVNGIGSGMSLLSGLFMLFVIFKVETLRSKFAFRMVGCLAVCDVGLSLGNILGRPDSSTGLCYVQAYLISYFTLGGVFWTTAIAYTLNVAIHHVDSAALGIHKKMRNFSFFCWLVPLVLTLLPQISNSYGEAGGAFCWIVEKPPGEFWRFAQFYGPLWCCMFYNIKVYVKAHATLSKVWQAGQHTTRGKALLIYPLLLVICYSFASINRIQNLAHPNDPKFTLFFLHILFSSLQGCLHLAAFMMRPSVREGINNLFWPERYELPALTSSKTRDETLEEEEEEQEHEEEEDETGRKVRRRRASTTEQLTNMSHHVRGTYLNSLGIYELMGVHMVDTSEGYKELLEISRLERSDEAEAAMPEKQPPQVGGPPKTGMTGTYLNLFKSFVGIGILALPSGFMHAGYILGTLVMAAVAYLAHHCMVILIKCKLRLVQEGTPSDQLTFSGIGEKIYGDVGRMVTDVTMVMVQVSAGVAYLIFIGENMSVVLDSAPITKAEYILMAAAMMLPLLYLKSLRMLVPAALLADVVMIFGLCSILGYDFKEMADKPTQSTSFTLAKFPLFFGTAVFAFEGIGLVLPLHESTSVPEKFDGILKMTMVVMTTLYVAFGAIGYIAWGEDTKDIITLNLPSNGFVRAVQVCYCIGLFCTSPIIMFPAFQIIEDQPWYNALPPLGGYKSQVLRTSVLVLAVSIAISVPHFGLFINMLGAFAGVAIAFILPSTFYLRLFHQELTPRQRYFEYFICVFGIVGGTVAFAVSVTEFIKMS